MAKRALAGRETMAGPEYPDTVISTTSLALALYYQGKYKEAEEMNRQVLESREKVLGKTGPPH